CRDLPGQLLFQYVDEAGETHGVDSADVNDYLREAAGEEFTAKDFRTWMGTVLAVGTLLDFESFDSPTQAKRNVCAAIEVVAKRLGNTPAICRKCYVHPAVIDAYVDGSLLEVLRDPDERSEWRAEELAVLSFLEQRQKGETTTG